jgi:hypothetical protein
MAGPFAQYPFSTLPENAQAIDVRARTFQSA